MRPFAIMVVTLAAQTAVAESWKPLNGPEIAHVLSEATLQYDGAVQTFYASGRTLYNAGRDSWGYWQVRGDMYCSQWPPSGLWDCYAMQRMGDDRLRFMGSDGSTTDGIISK